MPKFAEVAVSSFTSDTDNITTFDYSIPDDFLPAADTGVRVIVPFGSRHAEGYIINVKEETLIDSEKIKPIEKVVDPERVFSDKNICLARWMSEKYMCSLTDSLKCILPPAMIMKENRMVVLNTSGVTEKLSSREELIVVFLKKSGGQAPAGRIEKNFNFNISKELKHLSQCGIVSIKSSMKSGVREISIKGIELSISRDKALKLIDEMQVKTQNKMQAAVMKALINHGKPVPERELVSRGYSRSAVHTLIKKEIFKAVDINVSRDPCEGIDFEKNYKPELTAEQKDVIDKILSGYKKGNISYLIHGITGSGKTEVYMRVIEYMKDQGKQSIMLVPEISLTPQTIERFKGRFERVAVIHSRLSAGERYDEWKRIKNGEVDVVVGARSAVFVPFERLGAVIIDEEHESSYKSDKTPKYSTKEVAYERCRLENAMLILGSATPSIETYFEAQNGRYEICTMSKRIDGSKLPEIELIDMRDEIINGNKTIFSRRLYQEIKNALSENHQIILFLNRRGFSTFVSCRKCGHVMKCPHCDVSLTYHADKNMLNCHYCGYAIQSPYVCPSCGSKYIKYFGIGTQKIESEVKKYFSDARVLRMDLDTTTKKGSHGDIYNSFKKHEADILVGTQMISKGLDFPGVTLVGIIAADQSLNMPDYRSGERTFELITQVSGRAGRGKYDGRVIVQTYNPDHYSIVAALHQDYSEFFNKEIIIRKAFEYPPFADLINIVVSSKVEGDASETICKITDKIKNSGINQGTAILGPSPAPISKINNYFRWQTIVKGKIDEPIKRQVKSIISSTYIKNKDTKVNIDMNPINLL